MFVDNHFTQTSGPTLDFAQKKWKAPHTCYKFTIRWIKRGMEKLLAKRNQIILDV